MAIGHAIWETELFKDTAWSLSFGGYGIWTLNWIVLLSFLIESNLTNDSSSELTDDFGNTFSDSDSGFIRDEFNILANLLCFDKLTISKFFNRIGFWICASVNKSLLFHLNHVLSMGEQVSGEMILQNKKFFF